MRIQRDHALRTWADTRAPLCGVRFILTAPPTGESVARKSMLFKISVAETVPMNVLHVRRTNPVLSGTASETSGRQRLWHAITFGAVSFINRYGIADKTPPFGGSISAIRS